MAVGRQVKKAVITALADENWEQKISELMKDHPMQTLIAPLFSSLCAPSEIVRWHGISSFGQVVDRMFAEDAARARIVMRRIMWMLNEESGGCGWGVPEAMGEITASNKVLADEYGRILLSYIHEEEGKPENYLEFTLLLRGAIWGVARLAQNRPDIVKPATDDLIKFLGSSDPALVGIACWALGGLKAERAVAQLEKITDRQTSINIYKDRLLQSVAVGQLAQEALEKISGE
ncbi:DVU0298 family protein [Maridesulfovibrio ferrireducens]|uniref:DVU0298 family protein n=1 Tax=Maridesulfovibrio ferrireducens TaxID=246191 RepID=UPI001A354FB9|nr:DVU0298 family protein [Maridesulfovibrio ferrireducens]MBI9111288.1 HEAT repeat domain-containing protein [Maridesulfovibrio ferrireducens]